MSWFRLDKHCSCPLCIQDVLYKGMPLACPWTQNQSVSRHPQIHSPSCPSECQQPFCKQCHIASLPKFHFHHHFSEETAKVPLDCYFFSISLYLSANERRLCLSPKSSNTYWKVWGEVCDNHQQWKASKPNQDSETHFSENRGRGVFHSPATAAWKRTPPTTAVLSHWPVSTLIYWELK